jgi:SprB repeat
LVVSNLSQTNISCFGGTNGAASVSVSGGTPSYTYNWTPGNPTGEGTASVTGLTAGTWTCTVTDANSCVSAKIITITQPPALVVSNLSQTNISCFGGTNGAASVSVSGGTPSYTYNWTPGNPTGEGTASASGLTAGTWTCTVTDANSCVSDKIITISQPSATPPSNFATIPPFCEGEIAPILSSSSPNGIVGTWFPAVISNTTSGNYVFTPTSSCDIGQTLSVIVKSKSSSIKNLSDCNPIIWNTQSIAASGTYTAMFTNVAGCDSLATLNFTRKLATSYTTNIFDCNSIIWNTQNISTSGTYTAMFTNAAGCDSLSTLIFTTDNIAPTITCPANFTAMANTAGCLFTGSIGTATVTDNCSVASNTFLPAGPYPRGVTTVTHTAVDAKGNMSTCTQLVTITTQNVTVTASPSINLFTNDLLNLEIIAPISGFSYSWSGGGLSSSTQDLSQIVTSANSGVYTAAVTDAIGCSINTTITITVTPSAVLQLKALLSGPYIASAGLMQDSLRVKDMIPIVEPYGSVAYSPIFAHALNSNTGISCTTPSLLGSTSASTGANAIVDWVFLQLRSGSDSNIVLASRSALIQRDGDVVSEDGVSPVTFKGIAPGNYFISIKHRTHLGIMNLAPIYLTEAGTIMDYTDVSFPLYSRASINNNPSPLTGATRIMSGKRAMYTGNCNIATTEWSRYIHYSNTVNSDRTSMFAIVGSTGTLTGYTIFDIDMNGYARFNGFNSDRVVMLLNCANSNTIYVNEQTPN